MTKEVADAIKMYQHDLLAVKRELAKVIVGQERVIDGLLKALIVNGHVLVEGVPGIAKTLIVKSLAAATGCTFKRIQFTVDLLPTDITGIITFDKATGFHLIKGPVFTNFILADEINRGTPKTQSALLESMQEKQVTIGRKTYPLESPFMVMATQNPIESIGVYELPEAQMDRFLFKLLITYPSLSEEKEIIDNNTDTRSFASYGIIPAISKERVLELQEATKLVFISEKLKDYITRIVDATRNPKKYEIELGKYIENGSSPRASISMASAAKAEALLQGYDYVTDQHIRNVAHDVLRHRLILSYEGLASQIKPDDIVDEILSKIEAIS